jgi:alkanesulfonate monooxygenase SsuD/methylene tetrahydromethanopterin reductase-like flavin-dependent oxidoreductase (luciferase family)
MQAGASPRGRDFAARWAELIFFGGHGKADAAAYREDLHNRMAKHGRAPEDCAVLPSIVTVIGETASIAREKADYLESLVDKELVVAWTSNMLGVDVSHLKTEDEVIAAAGDTGIQGSRERVVQLAQAEGISFAEAVRRPRGLLVGTPAMIADEMADWFTSGACDGFIISPTHMPRMFEEFGRMVVPELQRRGLFRREYAGRTLRENLRNLS